MLAATWTPADSSTSHAPSAARSVKRPANLLGSSRRSMTVSSSRLPAPSVTSASVGTSRRSRTSPPSSETTIDGSSTVTYCQLRLHTVTTTPYERPRRVVHGARRHGGQQGRPLAPNTVVRIHALLHRALGQAVKWGWLTSNPASAASPPRPKRHTIVLPEAADILRLMVTAKEINTRPSRVLRVRQRPARAAASCARSDGTTSISGSGNSPSAADSSKLTDG